MLAGDLMVDPSLPAETDPAASNAGETAANLLDAEGENTPALDLVAFAQALAATDGVKLFGAAWCPACTAQKELFEDGGQFLPFVEVTNPDRTPNDIAISENITKYPTWKFPDGSRYEGVLSLAEISNRTGVAIPTSVDPFVAPIEDTTVLDGSPLHVGLDGYDPNGGPLTFTVTSSDESVVTATVLEGNRSAAIRFAGWGEMIAQLFEQRASRATDRFIELAESGFYDAANNDPDITAHRVKDDFMMQFGDPTGTGSGGSSLGDFDDQFHPDLQHNVAGIFSFAKSNDDTNDSQVFVIDAPTRHLDFNHSVFAMLTEGDKVRDAMTATDTDPDTWRPTVAMNLESVTIFDDTENGVVMLKAVEGATGTATITVTVTDEDGNTYVETFDVTVEPDTWNGGPFLNDIDPVVTTANNAATFQLSAVDVEGDAVFYGGVKTGTVDYTVSVDSTTGAASVMPPSGYVGTMDVLVYTRPATTSDTSDVYDIQTLTITVTPDAPQSVDLLAATDSGASNSDDITNATSLDFQVDGVTDGALVRLHVGNTIIGQATATGTSVTITTASLGEGTHNVFATQIVDNFESPISSSLPVTVDWTAPPEFTSTPPTEAFVDQLLSYDLENPEEGTAGTVYSPTTAPTGALLDPVSGAVSWTPGLGDVGTNAFAVTLTDLAGNARTQSWNIEVGTGALVGFRLEVTDVSGNPISSMLVGDEFLVNVYVADVAPEPYGVFSAFLDVMYDEQLVAVDGALSYGDAYPNSRVGDLSTFGIIDEAGAVAGTEELGGGEYLLLSVPMQAIFSGTANFTSNPADNLPVHELLRYAPDFEVDFDEVIFGSTSVVIEPAFGANDDVFNVDEDSGTTTFNPLANDEAFEGSTGNFTIVDVSSTSQGGTVTIATDGQSVEYTPADDFFGEETFTYTVSDGSGTDTATVRVQVMPVNDDPTATDDEVVVMEDTVDFVIDVLANDSFDPDENEELTILSVALLSGDASVSISPEGDRVLFTPAPNFFGAASFSYRVDDNNGGSDTATVTVQVTEENDPPSATNDLFQTTEDSSDVALDVLANDDTAGDEDETLSITSVGSPESGGTVTIASDGLSLIYTPAADFFGNERFTYEITDGNGGFAEAAVTVAVEGTNDPPTAVDDEFSVVTGTSDNVLDVLANDSSDPDGTEVLVVSAVGTPSAGGSVSVASDGLSVIYTPAADFTGEETFTYTLRDPDGATMDATATVTIMEYIPSKLSGKVYVDVDNDGQMDATETPVGGVLMTLVGTDMFGEAVSLTATTDALGIYEFVDLKPGSYEVVETQPQFLIDGIDRAGNTLYPAGTDSLPIELEQDLDVTGYDFGERGRTSNQISLTDFFASRPRQSVLVAANSNGGGQWYAVEGGWSHAKSVNFNLGSDMGHAELNVVTNESQQYSTTLDIHARDQVQLIGALGVDYLLRVVGDPDVLFPGADCGCADDAEAESESTAVVSTAIDAEGESPAVMPLDAQLMATTTSNRATTNLLDLDSWSSMDEAEGESTGTGILPTPADGYLATELLMAEPDDFAAAEGMADTLFDLTADDADDFDIAVDALMQESSQLDQDI